MKIGLFTSVSFNNIGNAFIDLGAEETIKAAVPECEIIKLSMFANFAASLGKFFVLRENSLVRWAWRHVMQYKERTLHDNTYRAVSTLDVLCPMKIAKFDYLIIPGCVLTVAFFKIYGKLLEEKKRQGCKLIFLGASGNYYTEKEISAVKEWLIKLEPEAIMFRDSVASAHYSDCSKNVFNGIDNVFFVNRLKIPFTETTMDPYAVINLEMPKHQKEIASLKNRIKGRNIIYTNHKPYPLKRVSDNIKNNIICSDYPLDYLFVYKHVKETYSDRVHACIPTLSFGNKAQLFSDSPRIALFENVGLDISSMKKEPISINMEMLNKRQEEQISFLKSVLLSK